MAVRRARATRRPSPRSQHFLRSRRLAAELVRDARVQHGELVVEIGAGTGRLTDELARAGARVVAIELDPRLAGSLAGRRPDVRVVAADAIERKLPDEPFRVVANVPFHRTMDLLRHLLDDPGTRLVRADLVVEWAVAVKRALPWPSSLNGVLWGAFFEASLLRRLPRSAFVPAPAVDAGVLVYRRRAVPLVEPAAASEYRRFVAAGFRHGPGRRAGGRLARDLDAHEWAALFAGRRGARRSAAPTGRAGGA